MRIHRTSRLVETTVSAVAAKLQTGRYQCERLIHRSPFARSQFVGFQSAAGHCSERTAGGCRVISTMHCSQSASKLLLVMASWRRLVPVIVTSLRATEDVNEAETSTSGSDGYLPGRGGRHFWDFHRQTRRTTRQLTGTATGTMNSPSHYEAGRSMVTAASLMKLPPSWHWIRQPALILALQQRHHHSTRAWPGR